MTAYSDVVEPKADEIATAKLAVDGEVEHRQIAFAVLDLKDSGCERRGPCRDPRSRAFDGDYFCRLQA
jgi:hypothetical protein